jgi:hypothetical protein
VYSVQDEVVAVWIVKIGHREDMFRSGESGARSRSLTKAQGFATFGRVTG